MSSKETKTDQLAYVGGDYTPEVPDVDVLGLCTDGSYLFNEIKVLYTKDIKNLDDGLYYRFGDAYKDYYVCDDSDNTYVFGSRPEDRSDFVFYPWCLVNKYDSGYYLNINTSINTSNPWGALDGLRNEGLLDVVDRDISASYFFPKKNGSFDGSVVSSGGTYILASKKNSLSYPNTTTKDALNRIFPFRLDFIANNTSTTTQRQLYIWWDNGYTKIGTSKYSSSSLYSTPKDGLFVVLQAGGGGGAAAIASPQFLGGGGGGGGGAWVGYLDTKHYANKADNRYWCVYIGNIGKCGTVGKDNSSATDGSDGGDTQLYNYTNNSSSGGCLVCCEGGKGGKVGDTSQSKKGGAGGAGGSVSVNKKIWFMPLLSGFEWNGSRRTMSYITGGDGAEGTPFDKSSYCPSSVGAAQPYGQNIGGKCIVFNDFSRYRFYIVGEGSGNPNSSEMKRLMLSATLDFPKSQTMNLTGIAGSMNIRYRAGSVMGDSYGDFSYFYYENGIGGPADTGLSYSSDKGCDGDGNKTCFGGGGGGALMAAFPIQGLYGVMTDHIGDWESVANPHNKSYSYGCRLYVDDNMSYGKVLEVDDLHVGYGCGGAGGSCCKNRYRCQGCEGGSGCFAVIATTDSPDLS